MRNALHTLGFFRTALLACIGFPFFIAANAFAQEPSPSPSPAKAQVPNAPVTEADTDRIIVTGSYLPTAETESELPITVYTAEALQKQGAQTPIEGLRQLPSFLGNTENENDATTVTARAFINLRGLGPENVLTLINGRRAFDFSNINAIPIAAISHVDVLKDSASAIYGSDAVAGVVNFSLLNGPGERPYEGAEVFTLYGNTTEKDAHVRQAFLRAGLSGLDEKLSIAIAAEYYSKASLYSRDRPRLAGTADLSNDATGLGLGGRNNTSPDFAGRVSLFGAPTDPFPQELVLNNLSNNAPTGSADYMPFIPGISQGYNFQETTPSIPAVEKAMTFVTGRYKIFGDALQVYGDMMYSKVKQYNGLSATPFTLSNAFDGLNVARASIFNPFPNNQPPTTEGFDANPQGNQLASVSYRLVNELGNRQTLIDADYYRYVAGINGDLNFDDNGFISRLGYDSGFVYSENDNLQHQTGDATRQGILDQIALGNFDPFIGQTAPVSGIAPTYTNGVQTGTHPYDNKAAAEAASYVANSNFDFNDYLYDIKINAHLFPNLWNGGVDFTVGYEHHENSAHFTVDPILSAGDQLGFDGAINADFARQDDSFFTQLAIPIVTSPMNVPLVRSFDVSIAFRYEKITDTFEGVLPGSDQAITREASFDNRNENEDFGGSPRVSLRYQPTEDITFRASWGQSFSSPNSLALFIPVHPTFPVLNDSLQGVTLVPPAGVFVGGNPNLKPEKTDAYSAGIIWTPKFIPGFTITMDWYQFFTTDLILNGDAFAQLALTANGNSGGTLFVDPDGPGGGGGFPFAPGGPGLGVTRTPAGDLIAIDATDSNAGKRLVQGLDIAAVYEIPTDGFGKFTIAGGYNHFFTWKAEPLVGLGTHNFLGNTSSSFPLAPGAIPFNKAFLTGEWAWRGFDFVATGNYIGDYEDDPSAIQGNTIIGGTIAEPQYALHRRTTDYITLDLQLSYEWTKPASQSAAATYSKDAKEGKNLMSTAALEGATRGSIWQRLLWGTTFTVGVDNVFDRYPPSSLSATHDNYDDSLYSIRNRFYYVSLTKKF